MTVTSETVVPLVVDSALLRADLEALLDALRRAEDGSLPIMGECLLVRKHWEKVLERADLLRQSYSLAKARAAGVG